MRIPEGVHEVTARVFRIVNVQSRVWHALRVNFAKRENAPAFCDGIAAAIVADGERADVHPLADRYASAL